MWIALLIAGAALASSQTYPTTWEDFRLEAEDALALGDDARAMELACHAPSDFMNRMLDRGSGALELSIALDEAMHRRYREACRAPANIEAMLPFAWDKAGRMFLFNGGPQLRIAQSPAPFSLAVDLNADGQPDLAYDGRDASIGEGFATAIDRDAEGRRAQWLLAPRGVDPRQRSQVLLYRDGEFFIVLVDVDGDGRGDMGRSGTTVRGESCVTESGHRAPPPVSLVPPKPMAPPDPEVARRWAAYREKVERALAAGDDAAVAELVCSRPTIDLKNYDLRFDAAIDDALGRRYRANFTPPANADGLAVGDWQGTSSATFGREGVDSWTEKADSTEGAPVTMWFAPHLPADATGEAEPAYLQVRSGADARAVVDLDLDGSPEIVYEKGEATIAPNVASAVDRSSDGRMAQWLVSPAGTDPRARARAWLCRDTGVFWILVDTDDDGISNCGWRGCM